jgi:hypothetical protein
MKPNHISTRRPLWAAAVAVFLVLAGAAVPAASVAAPQAGKAVVLEYKMPEGRVLTYQNKSEDAQVMDVMGQTMDTQTVNTSTITFKVKGLKEKNYLLGVTIEDIAVTVTSSAQGDMSPDMSSVKGKSFDMVLAPTGAEVDVSGAEAITYSIATETRDISSGFKTFFPDLPGKSVKIGDSWPASAAFDEKTGSMNIHVDLQYVHTLDGFETVDGLECARIRANVTGTISGTGSQQGLEMLFGGTHQGTDVWYFAVKEGFFIKSTSELTTDATISISGPQNMTIPSKSTRKSEVILASR